MTFDVIVAGLGAWGSCAAQHISARGQRVLGIDRYRPPHVHGSTHGHSRLINSKPVSTPANLKRILRSYELWRDLERASGRHLMDRIGWLHVGLPTSQRMAPSVIGTPGDVLSGGEIARRFPELTLRDGEVGVFDPEAAALDPEECVSAALEVAERRGAELRFDQPISGWSESENGVEVITAGETVHADWLVLALGAWTPGLSRLDLPLWTERQVMVWFENPGISIPGFSFPAAPPATSLYGMPESSGRVKVAFHHGGAIANPDSVAPVAAADIDKVCADLAERIPRLTRVVSSATCIYPNATDYQYVVGRHPLHPRVVVLAGSSGHGFHQAQAIGEMAADLVRGIDRPDIESLSLARFGAAD